MNCRKSSFILIEQLLKKTDYREHVWHALASPTYEEVVYGLCVGHVGCHQIHLAQSFYDCYF